MSKKKDLILYTTIVLDREYIEKHPLEECVGALEFELQCVRARLRDVAKDKILKIKKTGRL